MLSTILEICRNTPQGVDLNEIAGKLNKAPNVVEAMVDHLLRMGKLVEHRKHPICEMCPARRSCILLKSTDRRFSVSVNAVQDDNLNCQAVHTSPGE